jgi:hypothetical protein
MSTVRQNKTGITNGKAMYWQMQQNILLKNRPVEHNALIRSMWYDWFCKDTSLHNKGKTLMAKVKQIMLSPRFNINDNCIWFNNNCPCFGTLYDDFRIADIETGDVLFCVVPSNGHDYDRGKSIVWGHDADGKRDELVRGSWKDVVEFFMNPDHVLNRVPADRVAHFSSDATVQVQA